MKDRKIILLGSKDDFTNIIFNTIDKQFGIDTAIIEEKEDRKIFLKRRIKKLGLITVLGQIAFQIFIYKPLYSFSKKRIQKIISHHGLDTTEIPNSKTTNVTSVNDMKTIELLKQLNPDLIIINGTRIISKKVLSAVNCKFINTHAGITPKYRGVHGAYWALVNNDAENCGVTVHHVDEGIDTGKIIAQFNIQISQQDNFSTYPYLQIAEGIQLLSKAVGDFLNNQLHLKEEKKLESHLYYHPTIWQYLFNRIFKKVK